MKVLLDLTLPDTQFRFQSNEQAKAFYEALGRSLAQCRHFAAEDAEVSAASVYISDELVITSSYYRGWRDPKPNGRATSTWDLPWWPTYEAHIKLCQTLGHYITVGAVRSSDGLSYSFHS